MKLKTNYNKIIDCLNKNSIKHESNLYNFSFCIGVRLNDNYDLYIEGYEDSVDYSVNSYGEFYTGQIKNIEEFINNWIMEKL